MNTSKKFINIYSLIFKGIALILFILALIFPWSSLALDRFIKIGQLIIWLLYIVFIIGISITYIGILRTKLSKTIEEVGIFAGLISLGIYTFYIIFTMIFYPSVLIIFHLGFIFALLSVVIIFIDLYITRKKFNELLLKKDDEKKKDPNEEEEKESMGFFSNLRRKLSDSDVHKKIVKTTGRQAAKEAGKLAGGFVGEKAAELAEDDRIGDLTKKVVSKGVKKAGEKGVEKFIDSTLERNREEERIEDKKAFSVFSLNFINFFSILIKF
ncbi:MAG: hypothetical protein EU521_00465, partial [Promethearchaeota archaeon]